MTMPGTDDNGVPNAVLYPESNRIQLRALNPEYMDQKEDYCIPRVGSKIASPYLNEGTTVTGVDYGFATNPYVTINNVTLSDTIFNNDDATFNQPGTEYTFNFDDCNPSYMYKSYVAPEPKKESGRVISGTPDDPNIANMSGIILWVNASNIAELTPDNTRVVSLASLTNDKTYTMGNTLGSGPTVVQSQINNLPVLQFAQGDSLFPNDSIVAPSFTLFTVAKQIGGANGRIFVGDGNRLYGYWNGYKTTLYMEGWVDGGPSSSSKPSDTNWDLMVTSMDNTDLLASLSRNGSRLLENKPGAGVGLAGIYVNNSSNGQVCCPGEGSDCQVAEIILFNRKLTKAEIITVESYLMNKYQFSDTDIDPAHPYLKKDTSGENVIKAQNILNQVSSEASIATRAAAIAEEAMRIVSETAAQIFGFSPSAKSKSGKGKSGKGKSGKGKAGKAGDSESELEPKTGKGKSGKGKSGKAKSGDTDSEVEPKSGKGKSGKAKSGESDSEAEPKAGKGKSGKGKSGKGKSGKGKSGDSDSDSELEPKTSKGKSGKAKSGDSDSEAGPKTGKGKSSKAKSGKAKSVDSEPKAGKSKSGKAKSGKAKSGDSDSEAEPKAGKAKSGKSKSGKAKSGDSDSEAEPKAGKSKSGKAASKKEAKGKTTSKKTKKTKEQFKNTNIVWIDMNIKKSIESFL
jgi:hypothetical protein